MTKLSVNINKIATLRNARGGSTPDVIKAALDCQNFGADGITVHPRPDSRHITKDDVYNLHPIIFKEFNIEGYPSQDFIKMVLDVVPDQVTLVPDKPNVITSNAGWDTVKYLDFLTEKVSIFKSKGIRTSIFLDPNIDLVDAAKLCGTDRIELYTQFYAENYFIDKNHAIKSYFQAATRASEIGLEINAGHDLNAQNLQFFSQQIPNLSEVSIGHALISDALYLGLENSIQVYKRQL